MKMNLKLLVICALISSLIIATSAQNRYRNQRASSNRNRSSNRSRGNNNPREQGRTLGLLTPLLTLGLGAAVRPYLGAAVGYDEPIIVPSAYRPRPPPSSSPSSTQSDPYYGGYGGYTPNYYGGYPIGGYPVYRPIAFAGYPIPFFGGYRPPLYPANYGGYPPYNGYYGQRPAYNNPRPNPIAQRPSAVQQPAINSVTNTANPPAVRPPSTSGTTTPQINSAQAAQVANLLGQLLGQQLRPLLRPSAAAADTPANDVPGIAPSDLQDKRYRGRNYS